MSDQSNVVVNNVEKGQRDNPPKVRGRDRPFTDIRMSVSSGDRGGKSAEDRILRCSGMPQGQLGTVQQHTWSTRLNDRSSVAPSAYS
jgi:hypothetical protein